MTILTLLNWMNRLRGHFRREEEEVGQKVCHWLGHRTLVIYKKCEGTVVDEKMKRIMNEGIKF